MKILIDSIEVSVREHSMTQTINGHLKQYVEGTLGLKYESHVSRDGDQNFANLDKYCGDLVGRIGDVNAIVLEVKLKEGNQLPAYDDDQHRGLAILAGNGVPIHYCYNNFSFTKNRPLSINISSFSACTPELLGGKTPNSHEHEQLDKVVSELIRSGRGAFDAAVYSLAVSDICGDPTLELGQLTAKCLLMLYDTELGKICLFDQIAADRLIIHLRSQSHIAANKGTVEFVEKLNEFSNSIRQALQLAIVQNAAPPHEEDISDDCDPYSPSF